MKLGHIKKYFCYVALISICVALIVGATSCKSNSRTSVDLYQGSNSNSTDINDNRGDSAQSSVVPAQSSSVTAKASSVPESSTSTDSTSCDVRVSSSNPSSTPSSSNPSTTPSSSNPSTTPSSSNPSTTPSSSNSSLSGSTENNLGTLSLVPEDAILELYYLGIPIDCNQLIGYAQPSTALSSLNKWYSLTDLHSTFRIYEILDPGGHVGYLQKVLFPDTRVNTSYGTDQKPNLSPLGGFVEAESSVSEASTRVSYFLQKGYQYVYQNGSDILVVDNSLMPEQASQYESVFKSLNNGPFTHS